MMAYGKPELVLVGAASSLVLGGGGIGYDNVAKLLDLSDPNIW